MLWVQLQKKNFIKKAEEGMERLRHPEILGRQRLSVHWNHYGEIQPCLEISHNFLKFF
uniref:Uncharacterized protein n=1 Tax=Anguilla anguilla TaxID=7936 RepID=A0A0E9XF46_ANGAN